MDESDFEGSLILEKLAAIDKADEFFEAIDSDDLDKVRSLMRKAKVDTETMNSVIQKITEANGED